MGLVKQVCPDDWQKAVYKKWLISIGLSEDKIKEELKRPWIEYNGSIEPQKFYEIKRDAE